LIPCFFVSDLHGLVARYRKLFRLIERERPRLLFMGGDILPSGILSMTNDKDVPSDFINHFLIKELVCLQSIMGREFPGIFVILGNDDGRLEESAMKAGEKKKLWKYMHQRAVDFEGFRIFGYAYVPPTPFRCKDWERYDVSRYVDPGCMSPEEGLHSTPVVMEEIRYATISDDLEKLAGGGVHERSVFLFHTPPYQTKLDRAALDGKKIDHVPLDVHVGSIAVKKFIERYQPLLSLHGHIHESARLTGSWRDRIGRTLCFSAAHDGPELALVRFDLERPGRAIRELV
jgi:Icc-related predicted phosphoesterase